MNRAHPLATVILVLSSTWYACGSRPDSSSSDSGGPPDGASDGLLEVEAGLASDSSGAHSRDASPDVRDGSQARESSAAGDAEASTAMLPAIAAGEDHTCALLSSGTVECWGFNGYGQLGNGSSTGPETCSIPDSSSGACSTTPVAVSGLMGVVALAAGWEHTCALLSDGTVECWGLNAAGELGTGTTGPDTCGSASCSTAPVIVPGLTGVKAIAAGEAHTCALLSGGSVKCWGDNEVGELGDGTSTGPDLCNGYACSLTPVSVSGLAGVEAISANLITTCALLSGGTVECWGYNQDGELGTGVSTGPDTCLLGTGMEACSTTPVAVSGLSGVTAISAGILSACALLSVGTVECWGDNTLGELGIGTSTGPDTCSSGGSCSTLPVAVPSLTGVKAISIAGASCAMLSGGAVDCWGPNNAGQLGDGSSTGPDTCGTTPCSTTPGAVSGLSGVVAVSAGANHTCALLSGGAVECWGFNALGELGDGTSTGPDLCSGAGPEPSACSTVPVGVSGL
jgi:alpha-tubulin suppressor-like RCC1 family protein